MRKDEQEQDAVESVGETDSQEDGSEYQDDYDQQPDDVNNMFDAQANNEDHDVRPNAKDILTYNPQTEANEDNGDNTEANEYTLSELINQAVFGEVEKIAKPTGTGSRNFDIHAHMRLDTNDTEDEQLYNEFMVSPIFISKHLVC